MPMELVNQCQRWDHAIPSAVISREHLDLRIVPQMRDPPIPIEAAKRRVQPIRPTHEPLRLAVDDLRLVATRRGNRNQGVTRKLAVIQSQPSENGTLASTLSDYKPRLLPTRPLNTPRNGRRQHSISELGLNRPPHPRIARVKPQLCSPI